MKSVLVDVFEITGRGCVVLIDASPSLMINVGTKITIGGKSYIVGGVEMLNYNNAENLERIKQGWKPPLGKPPLGLLLRAASKADLVDYVGDEVALPMLGPG